MMYIWKEVLITKNDTMWGNIVINFRSLKRNGDEAGVGIGIGYHVSGIGYLHHFSVKVSVIGYS